MTASAPSGARYGVTSMVAPLRRVLVRDAVAVARLIALAAGAARRGQAGLGRVAGGCADYRYRASQRSTGEPANGVRQRTRLTTDVLVAGDNCFFAVTGITDGEVLKGVHYRADSATTQSLVMRSKSGTVRSINAAHRLSKLASFSSIDFA